jgi:poly(glycerol-phosphate) alpha-glucosyltransferase
MLDAWALGQHAIRKRLARLLYEDANLDGSACLHALNEAERQQIRRFGARAPIAVIPNGVDLPPREGTPRDTPACESLRGHKVLLFLSRLHPKKGLPTLVRAWRQCAQQHGEWMLAIAGPDEAGHRSEIESLVESLGLGTRVRLVGPQYGEDKDALFRRADAFVLPSLSEGFPVAVLEAMAYGLPVITTPPCNFPEAVECGAAVSAEPDVSSMGEAVRQMLSMSDAERSAMGARGRTLVQASYGWTSVAERMLHTYHWVLGHSTQPGFVETD